MYHFSHANRKTTGIKICSQVPKVKSFIYLVFIIGQEEINDIVHHIGNGIDKVKWDSNFI